MLFNPLDELRRAERDGACRCQVKIYKRKVIGAAHALLRRTIKCQSAGRGICSPLDKSRHPHGWDQSSCCLRIGFMENRSIPGRFCCLGRIDGKATDPSAWKLLFTSPLCRLKPRILCTTNAIAKGLLGSPQHRRWQEPRRLKCGSQHVLFYTF